MTKRSFCYKKRRRGAIERTGRHLKKMRMRKEDEDEEDEVEEDEEEEEGEYTTRV